MPQIFPRRIERGPLAGREFDSRADYRRALAVERGALTEYGMRSLRSRERGFAHYTAERRAKEAAAAPTRGEIEGTLPNGNDWRVVNYRIGRRDWHELFDGEGNRKGGSAPREADLGRITVITVWTEAAGHRTYVVDGSLESWADWYDLIADADDQYGEAA